MGVLAGLDHLANFLAPAGFLALVLAFAGRFVGGGERSARRFWRHAAVNFAAGSAVLAAGLALSGHDGRIATYAALAAAAATCQWWQAGGWRRG